MTLAMEGGIPIVRSPIKLRNTLSEELFEEVTEFISDAIDGRAMLSGYLAGSERGGTAVQHLENVWCEEFKIKYAVACNSGTSALLAACYAAGVHRNVKVIVPTMGMSAAAAAPIILGAKIRFVDVNEYFHISPTVIEPTRPDVVIAINLFGRPCELAKLRAECDRRHAVLIEDACQSLWASENGRHAGTVGHLGCYSFNTHKPLNAGEGGMVVTNDAILAEAVRRFINHGECAERQQLTGLNLRMTEMTAVMALSQIENSKRIVERCREISHRINPVKTDGVISDCYCLPILAPTEGARDYIVKALNAEGVPCRAGYMLMHKLKLSNWGHGIDTHLVRNANDYESRMILIELCSINPTNEQIEQMAEAVDTVWKTLW